MALKITKATDPIEVKHLVMTLYSVPGIGKTSLGFTADNALLLDFDHGAYRSKNRRDCTEVESWQDAVNMTAADLQAFKTLVVDTAGRALDCMSAAIVDEDPKNGNGGGGLSLKGYGVLKGRFTDFLRWIRSLGLDVVLLCHMDEQRKGDELIERLDIQGGSKNEIYKSADVMGRLYLQKGKRMLNFSPTDTAFGKNPAQLPPLEVPDFGTSPDFLGGVLSTIKGALNARTAVQAQAATVLATWAEKVTAAGDLAAFNVLVAESKEADVAVRDNVKRIITKAAKAKGLTYDKAVGAFVEAKAAAA